MRWRFQISLALGTSLLVAATLLATEVPPQGLTYLTISKYSRKDFKKAHVMALIKRGSRFEFDQIGELGTRSFGVPECKSLLDYSQSFPLSLMQERHYLDAKEAELQRSVGDTVLPEQVTFTEVSTLLPKAIPPPPGARRLPEARKGKVLRSVVDARVRQTREVRQSSMWMISGQTLHHAPTRSQILRHLLPWQNDPKLKHERSLHIDREKMPFIWEFGRGGQAAEGSIEMNLRALTLLAYQEMRHLGADPFQTEGYVFIHSLSESRTRLFQSLGATLYPESWADPSNAVLIFKLTDALKRFPPRELSGRIAQVVALSGGKLDDFGALELLDQNLSAFRTDLDFVSPHFFSSRGPVVLEDMTQLGYWTLLTAKLRRLQIAQPHADLLFNYLAQTVYSENVVAPHYFDTAPIRDAWNRYASRNAVQLSNLFEAEAVRSPDYVPAVLASTYAFYVQRLANHGIADAEQAVVNKSGMRFCIRTTSPLISAQLSALGSELYTKRTGHRWTAGTDIFMHFFTAEQIRRLPPARATLTEGHWARWRILSHPMQF